MILGVNVTNVKEGLHTEGRNLTVPMENKLTYKLVLIAKGFINHT